MNTRHFLFIVILFFQPAFGKAEFAIELLNASLLHEKIFFNYYEEEIIERLRNMSSIVSTKADEDVISQVKRYIVNDRSGSKSILYRGELYFPLIERLLFDNNLPFQLKNLAALESALNPRACSYAGAAGLWQLMPETARRLGLKVNKYVDERLDPVSSTKAAINYLKKLYLQFEDWSLVLAAYNCGENKIQSLLEETGSKDFGSIKKYLPRQTQLFVPTFVGVSYLLEYYTEHDLVPEESDLPNSILTYVKIDKGINLSKMFKSTQIDKDIFKLFNPSFKQNDIKAFQEGVYVSLPDSMMVEFVDYYLKLHGSHVDTAGIVESPENNLILELISFARPNIESPEYIADKETSSIVYNPQDYSTVKDVPTPKTEQTKNYEYYILKTGESLADVSEKYKDISLEDLMNWNEIGENDVLVTGTVLIIKQ